MSRPSLRHAFTQPAAFTLFCFGFASGLPFLLVGGTLSTWLKETGLSLEQIGLVSLAGLAYSLKFLWAPAVDHVRLPGSTTWGQRRSWLLLAQFGLVAALLGMAELGPADDLRLFIILVVLAALAGATQDVVVDAYRIEIAPPAEQGALAATYTLGYRLALLCAGALALVLADHVPWREVYRLMAGAMGVVMLATVAAREPAERTVRATSWEAALQQAVVDPFSEFFQRFGSGLAVAVLLFMGLFKISDQMIGVMALPFYLDCGFSKTEIGTVSKIFGVWIGVVGAFLGGAAVVWAGIPRTLLVAMLLGAATNLLYVVLAWFPGDLRVFVAVIGVENLAGGFLGTAAVAWLSSLVNRQHTATQYALFSSLVALPGKLVGGFSGFMVAGMGYAGFFLFSAVAILPALLLFFWLQPRLTRIAPHEPTDSPH